MFGKLLVIIVGIALTAVALVVMRQQRIDTHHEIAETYERLREHERTLWEFKSRIAHASRPDEVVRLMVELDEEWTTIPDAGTVPTAPPPLALTDRDEAGPGDPSDQPVTPKDERIVRSGDLLFEDEPGADHEVGG